MKKRLSKDAFSWVQNTAAQGEEPKPAKKTLRISEQSEKPKPAKKASPRPAKKAPARAAKPGAVPESGRQRSIFVEYDKKDGQIIATHEVFRQTDKTTAHPWTTIPKDRAVARIVLSEELLDKKLIDIHRNYKVVISNRKPALVPKE
jgi:hypothetical protein